MDVYLFYYKKAIIQIDHVYLGSQFIGYGASDNMDDFKKVHGKLDIVNDLVQLSMDGRNVNWAFHEVLESYQKSKIQRHHLC